MGRREDRLAGERVGYAVMWTFVVLLAGAVFPPLWVLLVVPLVVWLVRRSEGGGSRRDWAGEFRGRVQADEWVAVDPDTPPGWYPHPREKQHVLRWWDGRGWTLHRFDARARAYLPAAKW